MTAFRDSQVTNTGRHPRAAATLTAPEFGGKQAHRRSRGFCAALGRPEDGWRRGQIHQNA
jgi:hypothetical protein